jgi:hypothetical protein
MKIIPKENAFIYCINDIYYCVDRKENALLIKKKHLVFYQRQQFTHFINDITVNGRNELHSFNDQPVLFYNTSRNSENSKTFIWYQNGKRGRENNEKPYYIQKAKNKRNSAYYIMENEEFREVNYYVLKLNH